MTAIVVRNATLADLPKLRSFISRYRTVYADAKLAPADLYLRHPAAEEGRNVTMALDETGTGDLVGFAPLFPAPVEDDAATVLPHQLWTIVLADPTLDEGVFDPDEIRGRLLDHVVARAEQIAETLSPRPTRLAADLMVSQLADIAFLEDHGFTPFRAIYVMRRSPAPPVPDLPLPPEVELRHRKLATETEQLTYLAAYNACFPQDPKTLEGLRFLLDAPIWAHGIAVAAVAPGRDLVGSVLAYVTEDGHTGIVDDVFVLPAWRGRGIAKALVADAIRVLSTRGVDTIRLEVRSTNGPAVAVYTALGFEVINEEIMLGRWLREPPHPPTNRS